MEKGLYVPVRCLALPSTGSNLSSSNVAAKQVARGDAVALIMICLALLCVSATAKIVRT